MKKTNALLVALAGLFYLGSLAQTTAPPVRPLGNGTGTPDEFSLNSQKKGTFFITPFYEFTRFDKLKLISHTNYYTVWEGEHSYKYTSEDIKSYNDNYGTAYHNSMTGIKVGYQVMNGLGISAYAGINHYNFRSWISDENTQSFDADYPALTLGLAANYLKKLDEHWTVFSVASCNFTSSKSVKVQTTTGEEIVSSSLKSMYWELNLAMAYRIHRFLPLAGVGFTQQFVHPVTTEQLLTQDDNGNDFYEKTKFDSHYRGSAVYGFAGIEYSLNEKLSVYVRSSFLNPFRMNLGLRITL
ncbi:MAG: hypothetical protein WCR72_19455 [Bacteroidota bacterium]